MSRHLGYTMVEIGQTPFSMAERWRGMNADRATDGSAPYKTEKQVSGTRYNYGRSGFRSLMDRQAIDNEILDYKAKYAGPDGKAGVYNLKICKDDGTEAGAGSTIEIGGRLFRSDANSRLRILDSQFINEEILATKSQREYQESILEAVLVSDDMARLILNDAFAHCAAKSGKPVNISPELDAVNCQPNTMRYLDPTSVEYARCLAKLRLIIHQSGSGIIINEEGGKLGSAGGTTGPVKANVTGHDFGKAAPANA